MTDVLELTDFDLLVESETWEPTPCESPTHRRGICGHVPASSAVFLAVPPCGCSWAVCAGWVDYMAVFGLTYTGCACGDSHSMTETRFLPLDIK